VDARRAFLENIEAELTTANVAHSVKSGRSASRGVGRFAAAAVLVGASFLTLSATATAASAAPATAQTQSALAGTGDCYNPNHVQYTHTKQCVGITWVRHVYKYTYSPNGGIVHCYVFDSEINNPCGGGTVERESCA
jgi:hypothetical protein